MSNIAGKTPFLRLLIPVVVGIIANEFIPGFPPALYIGLLGTAVVLSSFFFSKNKKYTFRWVFGVGIFTLIFAITAFQYQQSKDYAAFRFPAQEVVYKGYVLDIPQQKPRSIGGNIRITYPVDKKAVLYFEKNADAYSLQPGDEIIFSAKMQPFKNTGNPNDFDYARFMRIKGYAGTAYIPSHRWMKQGNQKKSLYTLSQKMRAKALVFYRSFGLNADEYALISALTLGYKSELSDNIQEAFRASGTAHVLAVSGLHVGIIYAIIFSLLSFLGNSGKKNTLKQILIILCLWGYAFLAGLPVSVIRATIMLTIFCGANAFHRKGFSYNTLAIAAFFILLYNPMSLFEVGFQMSFAAVFAILFFKPKMDKLFTHRNKISKAIGNMFTVTLSAQLGVFPLVLYYFGTFPTYFFITNLIIVPLIGILVYSLLPVLIFSAASGLHIVIFTWLFAFFKWILVFVCDSTLRVVYFFETLPFAQLSGKHITFVQVFLIFTLLFSMVIFLEKRKFRPLFIFLVAALALSLTQTAIIINKAPDRLIVYNRPGITEIGILSHNRNTFLAIPENGIVPHETRRIIRLSTNVFNDKIPAKSITADYLILSEDNTFSMKTLSRFVSAGMVILDSSLSRYAASKIAEECSAMGINVHDVAQTGAFSINL